MLKILNNDSIIASILKMHLQIIHAYVTALTLLILQ